MNSTKESEEQRREAEQQTKDGAIGGGQPLAPERPTQRTWTPQHAKKRFFARRRNKGNKEEQEEYEAYWRKGKRQKGQNLLARTQTPPGMGSATLRGKQGWKARPARTPQGITTAGVKSERHRGNLSDFGRITMLQTGRKNSQPAQKEYDAGNKGDESGERRNGSRVHEPENRKGTRHAREAQKDQLR